MIYLKPFPIFTQQFFSLIWLISNRFIGRTFCHFLSRTLYKKKNKNEIKHIKESLGQTCMYHVLINFNVSRFQLNVLDSDW